MHLHNPGICAVGGTEQFVLTGNVLVLFTSGLLLPKKTLKQAKKCLTFCQPWSMQRILESCSSQGCCWLRCQILDAFPTDINRTLVFLHVQFTQEIRQKWKMSSAPHTQSLLRLQSQTLRERKKRVLELLWAFWAALCVQIEAQQLPYWYPSRAEHQSKAKLLHLLQLGKL